MMELAKIAQSLPQRATGGIIRHIGYAALEERQ